MLPTKQPEKYTDGRTKQSFKDETDINKLLQRAQKTGTISHLSKYEGVYGDFANFDFFEAQIQLAKGREVFDALPSEIRDEFRQSPADFFEYVNDPANKDRLGTLLPDLAAPGKQNISVTESNDADATRALEEREKPEDSAVDTATAEKPVETASEPPTE